MPQRHAHPVLAARAPLALAAGLAAQLALAAAAPVWTLLCRQTADGTWLRPDEWRHLSKGGSHAPNYSILDRMEDYRTDGKFTFKCAPGISPPHTHSTHTPTHSSPAGPDDCAMRTTPQCVCVCACVCLTRASLRQSLANSGSSTV